MPRLNFESTTEQKIEKLTRDIHESEEELKRIKKRH